jgi:hypothetical protein
MDLLTIPGRVAAPIDWLAGQISPDLGGRVRLIETCRAELTWARADGLAAGADDEGWQDLMLPHERTAARLLDLWGHLHPIEHRLREGLGRLKAQRRAGWPSAAATLADVQRYRSARRQLLRAFLEAAAGYRQHRTPSGAVLGLSPCSTATGSLLTRARAIPSSSRR